MLYLEEWIGLFWASVKFGEDERAERLRLLRDYGEIAVPRFRGDPTQQQIRDESRQMPLPSRRCFVCGRVNCGLQAHHIIEVQNGGTNREGNRVSLCVNCHCALHPWMKRNVSKYYSRRDRGSHEWSSLNPALRVTPVNWREPADNESEETHGMGAIR